MKTGIDQRLRRIAGHDFVRRRPCAEWVHGMMLGNGDLGVMAWGAPTQRLWTVNKADVWDYRAPHGKSVLPPVSLEEIRRLVAAQDHEGLRRVARMNTANSAHPFPTIQPAATVRLEIADGSQTWNFEERLSMATAELETSYTAFDNLWSRGEPLRETTFVCATRPIVAHRVSCADGRPHGHRISLLRNENVYLPAPSVGVDGERIHLTMRFPDGLLCTTMLAFRGVAVAAVAGGSQAMAHLRTGGMDDGEWAATVASFQGTRGELDALSQGPPRDFEVYATTVRGYGDEQALLAEAHANLDAALAAGFDTLRAEHRQWWREYWQRGYLEIDRPASERLWFFGLYTLASCSREGCQAAGLQGVWSNQDAPPWNSDYHNDVNIQANYWSAHGADHLEQAEPFFRLYEHMADQARRDTAEYYGSSGMKLPMAAGPDGHELVGHFTCGIWPGGTAWLLLHFWWHYLYTGDRDWLRDHAWPLFADAARFYADYLLPDGAGGLKVFPSYSPENVGVCPESLGSNGTCDLALIKAFLKVAAEAAEILGADDELAASWRDLVARLPEYPTIERCYTVEGEWSRRFKDLEERDFDFHCSHLPMVLQPVYPAQEITAWTGDETLRQTALATLDRWKERTGRRPMGGFAGEYGGHVQARLGLPSALTDLDHMARAQMGSAEKDFVGFFGANPRFMQVDWILGFPGPLTACLLLNVDAIRVFPAVPGDFSGRFEGLRVEGGFRVRAAMERGTVQWVELESLVGGPCRIAAPWPATAVRLNDSAPVEHRLEIITIDTTAGDHIRLEPAEDTIANTPNEDLS